MKSSAPLTPATISPKLTFEVSMPYLRSELACGRRHSNLRSRMEPIAETAALAAHAGRAAGTDAERRAAVHLRSGCVQPAARGRAAADSIRPALRAGSRHHVLSWRSWAAWWRSASPAVGTALVGAATVSAFLDVAGILHLARRLTGKRASQNVESREDGDKPGTLILVAPYDARGRAGGLTARDAARCATRGWRCCSRWSRSSPAARSRRGHRVAGAHRRAVRAHRPADPAHPRAGRRRAGRAGEARPGTPRPWPRCCAWPTSCASLEHFDVRVVLTGAEQPFALGMGAWLRAAAQAARPRAAAVVVTWTRSATGRVRYARRVGPLLPLRCHRDLRAALRRDRRGRRRRRRLRRRRAWTARPTDAAAAIARGLPAISVACVGRRSVGGSLERAYGFCARAGRRLDAEVGPPRGRWAVRPA